MPPEIVSGALHLIYIYQWVSVEMRLKTTWETPGTDRYYKPLIWNDKAGCISLGVSSKKQVQGC